jgi:hypothetical protein
MPDDIYILDYNTRFAMLIHEDIYNWNDATAPSITKPLTQTAMSTQSPRTSNSSANSNDNPSILNA